MLKNLPRKKILLTVLSTLVSLCLALVGVWRNGQEPLLPNGGVLSRAEAIDGVTLTGWAEAGPGLWSFSFTAGDGDETLALCTNYKARLISGGSETEAEDLYLLPASGRAPVRLLLESNGQPSCWVTTAGRALENQHQRQMIQLQAIACFGMMALFVLALFYFKHQRELGYFLLYLSVMIVWAGLIYRFPSEGGASFRLLFMFLFSCMLLSAFWVAAALTGLLTIERRQRLAALFLTALFALFTLSSVTLLRVGALFAGMLACQGLLLYALWKEIEGAELLLFGCAVSTGLRVLVILPGLRWPIFIESLPFYILRCARIYDLPFALGCMFFVCRRFAQQFDRTEQLARELDRRVAQRTQALAEQVEARESMMLNIFHDLRSPLFAVANGLETLSIAPDTLPGLLPALQERVSFLRRLTEDLFLAAKLEQNQILLNEDRVLLNEQTALVCTACMAEAKKKGVSLTSETGRPLLVWGDAVRLQQVVQNLVTNAIYYTPAGGSVEVACRAEGGQALVSVRDTGCGIPPEEQAAVFQRYFHTSAANKHESTGLGLTIAQELVRLHHGVIQLESEVGRGSCFTVRLDLLEPDEELDEEPCQ